MISGERGGSTVGGITRLWPRGWTLRRSLPTVGSFFLLVVAVAVNAMLQPFFFSAYSIESNLNTFVPLIAAAVGQTIIILGGGIDLSLGTIITLSNVVTVAVMAGQSNHILLGIAAGLAVGAGAGLVNGLLAAVLRLQPIVATFATSFVWSGIALYIMPRPGGSVPMEFFRAYRSYLLGVPAAAWVILAIIISWITLKRHRLGRHIYAVGGDEAAAFASGVPVTRVKVLSYVLGGLFAGLSGLAIVADTATGDPFVGDSITLTSIVAVVIGGTRLAGGSGGAGGSIAGAIVLGLVANIIFFANVSSWYQELINGLIVIAALALAGLPTMRRRAAL